MLFTGRTLNVVLIDDDEEDYMLIRDMLDGVGHTRYAVRWVPNYLHAREEIGRQDADVYLVDYRLNDGSGLELLRNAKERTKPMILLTGQADRETDHMAMEAGACDFLPKSNLTSNLLERSIRYCIKRAADQFELAKSAQLRIEKESAAQANAAKSLFLANVSHELRTPLCAIISYAELSLDRPGINDGQGEYMEVILRNGRRLLEMLDDLLDLSKIEAGHLTAAAEDCNWREIVDDVVALLKPAARRRGLDFHVDYAAEMPASLYCDGHRLRQILVNLVSNAVKFTECGGFVRIQARVEAHSRRISFYVSDNGRGISGEQQEHLFKPFSQADAQTCQKYGGTGLGLDLSRKLAQIMGGELQLVESALGQGSTFCVRLPLVNTEKNTEENTEKHAACAESQISLI